MKTYTLFQGPTSSLMSFDETPVGGKGMACANSDPFDETPLPAMTKSSSLKFGDIASRSKSSSIAFDYQVQKSSS